MSDVDKSIDELAEEDMVEAEAEPVNQKTEYVEFVGIQPYGTEFSGGHSISAKHMKEYHDVELGAKELSWTKGKNGRFLVPMADMTPEAAEVLLADPMFRKASV